MNFVDADPSNCRGVHDNNYLCLTTSTSFFFLASFTKTSRYSNSLGIMKMVSMGVKKVFPLTKCDSILNLMFPYAPRCPNSLFSPLSTFSTFALDMDACIGILCFGILTPGKTLCCTPHSQFNLINVASLSLTNTSKKFVEVNGHLPFFFQHISFVCPMFKQKKHLRPQLCILCPPPHLVHLGFKSVNIGHANAIRSFDIQSWHWMMLIILGLDPLLPFVLCPK